MRVFLTGSTGYIGGNLLEVLCRDGYAVTCLVRKSAKQKLRSLIKEQKNAQCINIVEGEWIQPEQWLHHLTDHDVLINTIGIIRETFRGEFEAIHHLVPVAVFKQAQDLGIKKIIQVSALGADETAKSKFHISKYKANQYLITLDTSYLILRPSFVYGLGGSSMTFFASLAALPLTPVPGDGQYRVQPVHIRDLLKAIEITVNAVHWKSMAIDVGGSDILTFNEMLDALSIQLGKEPRLVHIPWSCMELIAKSTDLFPSFGPISTEELRMLKKGNFCDNSRFTKVFGFEPVSFLEAINEAIPAKASG